MATKLIIAPACYHVLHLIPIRVADEMNFFVDEGLQDEEGNPLPTYSIAAGLDYPGVGPEHSHLKTIGRAEYVSVTNEEVLEGFQTLSKVEGIIPALESSHAVAYALKLAPTLSPEDSIIVSISGRGDKDVEQVFEMLKK